MNFTKHFSEEEFLTSQTAIKYKINNFWLDSIHRDNAIILCNSYLEIIRKNLEVPLILTSAYRTEKINSLINGNPRSRHLSGEAVDMICPLLTCDELSNFIINLVKTNKLNKFDQIILKKNYIHFGIRIKEGNRGQILDENYLLIETL